MGTCGRVERGHWEVQKSPVEIQIRMGLSKRCSGKWPGKRGHGSEGQRLDWDAQLGVRVGAFLKNLIKLPSKNDKAMGRQEGLRYMKENR